MGDLDRSTVLHVRGESILAICFQSTTQATVLSNCRKIAGREELDGFAGCATPAGEARLTIWWCFITMSCETTLKPLFS